MWSFLSSLSLPTPNDARPRPPPPSSSVSPTNPSSSTSSPSSSSPDSPDASSTSPPPNIIQRNRPLALLLTGTVFTILSARATRRAFVKRRKLTKPHFYHPSNEAPLQPVSGALEAVEALSLATVNVASWAVLWSGGVLWALGVADVQGLRRVVRGGLGVDGSGRAEGEVEEELEEWLARVLERGREKGKVEFGEEDLKEAVRLNERGKPR